MEVIFQIRLYSNKNKKGKTFSKLFNHLEQLPVLGDSISLLRFSNETTVISRDYDLDLNLWYIIIDSIKIPNNEEEEILNLMVDSGWE